MRTPPFLHLPSFFSHKMVNEAAISAAIADLKTQTTPNYGATAKKYNISRDTLRRRYKGETTSRSEAHLEAQGLLSNAHEKALVERINILSARGIPPTPAVVRNLVIELTGALVGEHWVSRFVERHRDQLYSVYLDSIDYSRRVADNIKHFSHYFMLVSVSFALLFVKLRTYEPDFGQLEEKIRKYRIKPSNMYNMDEKGFLMGICNTMKRVVSIQQLKSKKLLGAAQDGSREFLSLLAGICADGSALPPGLIYQGESHDLQDTWLEDYDSSIDTAWFAASPKGWTNEELGISWLTGLFERNTAEKAGLGWRLLIVDGHSSHVNMRSIDACDERRIILAILPPHSTHRLQPLDLKIFSPLSTAYSQEIDRVIQRSQGFTRITKRSFWSMFKLAWTKALTKANILSAFAAGGLQPLNPKLVLDQIKMKTPTPPLSDGEARKRTPGSVRAVRRQIKAIQKAQGQLNEDVALLARACEKLVINNEILEHENGGLREALQTEKKRRKRGKMMGLFPKDEPGQAMFFSPAKIAAVRAHQEGLEAQKEQEKLDKELERRAKAAEKERKAQETQERRQTRQKKAAERRALREREKETHRLQNEADKQLRLEQQALKEQIKLSTIARKRKPADTLEIEPKRVKVGIARSGRSITLPKRFQI